MPGPLGDFYTSKNFPLTLLSGENKVHANKKNPILKPLHKNTLGWEMFIVKMNRDDSSIFSKSLLKFNV